MDALFSGGNGGVWAGLLPSHSLGRRRRRPTNRNASKPSSNSVTGNAGYRFPLRQAATAASLAFAGDTIAQIRSRWIKNQSAPYFQDAFWNLLSDHDWLRAIRMTSYGFLLYGPGSYLWYQCLDRCMPMQTVENIMAKVVLNQIVLGPSVIAVVFAWNNLWQGKLAELPRKYQNDALPTLFFGFRFWIPVSILNFWAVPLHARVAFMSLASIFWNFWLSSTMSK